MLRRSGIPENDFVFFGNPLLEFGICGIPVDQVYFYRKVGFFERIGEYGKLPGGDSLRRNDCKIEVRERFRAFSNSRTESPYFTGRRIFLENVLDPAKNVSLQINRHFAFPLRATMRAHL